MSNVQKVKRQPVYIELDKQRELKYTLNSFAEMEEKYGSVDDALAAMEKGSVRAVRFMLYVGLKTTDPTLTEETVGNLIELQDMEEIAAKMGEVMTVDLPDRGEAPNAL